MFIEFGLINYKLIIPFIYPVLSPIREYLMEDANSTYELFTIFCGYVFSGLFYIFIKCRMKKRKIPKTKEEKEKEKEKEHEKKTEQKKIKNFQKAKTNDLPNDYLNAINKPSYIVKKESKEIIAEHPAVRILLLAIVNFMAFSIDIISYETINAEFKIEFSLFFNTFFYVVLSKIVLKGEIYQHHKFSLYIIIICATLLSLVHLILIVREDKYDSSILTTFAYLIIYNFFYALYDVMNKKYLSHYTDSPYNLMFKVGSVNLILIIIFERIARKVIYNKDQFIMEGIFDKIKDKLENPLIIFFDIVSAFIWMGGAQMTIYFFTPCHFIISESLSTIIVSFRGEKFDSIVMKTFFIITSSIVVFSSFIYNEVLIINIGSLAKNTKKKLEIRERQERDTTFQRQLMAVSGDNDSEGRESSNISAHPEN